MKKITGIFFRESAPKVFMEINNNKPTYSSLIAKKTNVTYSHAVKIFERIEKAKLINFEKVGRTKYITASPKGIKLQEQMIILFNLLESCEVKE